MHEGMALGLMAVFSDLVSAIRKASIHKSMEWFQDKFSTLRHLGEHGFSIQSFHSTLTKLVKIKFQHTICLGEIAKVDVELEGQEASLTRIGALLDEKDRALDEKHRDLAELEQELGCLRQKILKLAKEKENKETELGCLHQEIQKLAKEKENKETELPILKSKQSKFKEAYADAEQEFHSVLALLPGSNLT